jgi:predicted lipoprotein with Yx(FWY)xxD motif
MRALSVLLVAGVVAVGGCGGDEDDEPVRAPAPPPETTERAAEPEQEPEPKPKPAGTVITLGDSEFGSMLFDSKRQAIYIFERDKSGESACYGECAEAWPPVFTKGEPQAAKGVEASLLGTVKRRDGRTQVTYAGKPLYFYAHEGPGEVLCHNVNLNGGLWWVVGPDGMRRA